MTEEHSLPGATGRLWVIPSIRLGGEAEVWIGGDPEGLRSFGELLVLLAGVDQEDWGTPRGSRVHLHLRPKRRFGDLGELGASSCVVTVSRADASGTGEIGADILAAEEDKLGFTPDSALPKEWLDRAGASLELARTSAIGSDLTREHVPALAAQASFCALMAGLRVMGATVPEGVDYLTQLAHFVPENVSIPLRDEEELDELHDVLAGEMPLPDRGWKHPPSDEEIAVALERAEKMVAWAGQLVGAAGENLAS